MTIIDQTFPSQVSLHRMNQYDFDYMKVTFGNLIETGAPLIAKYIHHWKSSKGTLEAVSES